MQQIENLTQNKKASKFESLLICNSTLAGEVALNWNTIYPSLICMALKLEKLGLVYYDGQVHDLGAEGSDNV